MTNECSIVKDLLPLYAEDLTSAETADFVKTHLAGCESCREEYVKIKESPQAAAEETAAPLKAVKRKLTRKRIIIVLCAAVCTRLIGAAAFQLFDSRAVHEVYHDWSQSAMYPEDQIAAAADAVQAEFRDEMRGCKLYSLTYAGDEVSAEELAYINEFGKYDHCIVFRSMFRSPIFGGGGWNANDIYRWSWYLGRVNGGEWEVVQRGYP